MENPAVATHACHCRSQLTGHNRPHSSNGSQGTVGGRGVVQSHPVPRVAQNWNDVAKSTDHDKLFPKIITCNSENCALSLEKFCLLTSHNLGNILNFE